jgi:circadian clock protein KaiC
MVTAGTLARTGIDYKKFINELQTWVGVVGCTVLFLTSVGSEPIAQPENSMVDGIFELQSGRWNLQATRHLSVAKFRGSAFAEGAHSYLITSDGITVFPRIEGSERTPRAVTAYNDRASIGDRGLDQVLGGGLRRGSSTLLLGPPGSGKTTAGLQFLGAGVAAEPAVYFGFVEPPADILARGDALGIGLRRAVERRTLAVLWNSPTEALPDKLGHQLLDAARQIGARRVFIDGLFGFRSTPERLGGFIDAISHQLESEGATTVISDEISELPTPVADSLSSSLSAFTDNILLLQNLNTGLETARLLTVLKTRQSGHDPRSQRYHLDAAGLRVLEPLETPAPPELDPVPPPPRRAPRAGPSPGKGGKRRRK